MKIFLFALVAWIGIFDDQIPELNQKIVNYCKASEGKKIDRGECWDLAAFALNEVKAKWSPPYNFGTKYDFKKEAILAGDGSSLKMRSSKARITALPCLITQLLC